MTKTLLTLILVLPFAVTATAYYQGSHTATGHRPRIGIIAVDPHVIPLGSTVCIKGYGTFVADDTGGAIRGHRIDMFIPSRSGCMRFGRRRLQVTIVKGQSRDKNKHRLQKVVR